MILAARSAMEHVFDGVAPDFALRSSTSRCLKANALRLSAALFLLVLSTFGNSPEAQSGKVLVFAAASLKTALDEINAQWQGRTGKRTVVSYAASSALAKQIQQGGAQGARRLGAGQGSYCPGRERARRTPPGLPRRSAARHRLRV